MFGEVSDKHVNLVVEGSLLPPVKYENVSDKYLMIWLELLVNEANNTNQFLFGSKQVRVNTFKLIIHVLCKKFFFYFIQKYNCLKNKNFIFVLISSLKKGKF